MKLYFLLRNNVESGPYTQKDFSEIGLTSTDLIWIDGESTAWQHPDDIVGLKSIARLGIIKALTTVSNPTSQPEPSYQLSPSNDQISTSIDRPSLHYAIGEEEVYPVKDKESFSWENRRPRINAAAVANSLFGLGVLMVGVMLFAFVVKKLVDHFEYEPYIGSAEAVEISSENVLASQRSHAAMGVVPVNTTADDTQATTDAPVVAMNAVAATPQLVASAKTENVSSPEEKRTETSTPEPEVVQTEVSEEKKPEEKEAKPVVKAAPNLSLTANDYKVGVFGGISDLEITVNNPSSSNIDKAVVEVEFLKPNGNVVKSQTVAVENISAGGAKKVVVPSSNRGVKIRYRVVSTDVNDGKVASNDI